MPIGRYDSSIFKHGVRTDDKKAKGESRGLPLDSPQKARSRASQSGVVAGNSEPDWQGDHF